MPLVAVVNTAEEVALALESGGRGLTYQCIFKECEFLPTVSDGSAMADGHTTDCYVAAVAKIHFGPDTPKLSLVGA